MYSSDIYPIDYKIKLFDCIWIVTAIKGSKWWELHDPKIDLKPNIFALNAENENCQNYIGALINEEKICKILSYQKLNKSNLIHLQKIYPSLIILLEISKKLYRQLDFCQRLKLVIRVWTYQLVYI